MFSNKLLTFGIVACSLLMPVPHCAHATDVQITKLSTIDLGTWNRAGNAESHDDVCIYRSDAGASYGVTATDDSTLHAAGFHLENGAHSADIPYTITWDTAPPSGGTTLTDGAKTTGADPDTTSQNCSGGTNARATITVNSADLAAVPAGTYTATVQLVIEP